MRWLSLVRSTSTKLTLKRVRFICKTPNDGMPKKDPEGRENPNIPYRQVIIKPGADYKVIGWVDRDIGILRPSDSNFLTYNKLLSYPHARIEHGRDNYSILLEDYGLLDGTSARTGAPNPGSGVGEHDLRWTKLEPRTKYEVRSGMQLKFGEHLISPDRQSVTNGLIWEAIIEQVDEELEAKILAAAEKRTGS
ncbi:hypothetical protein UCDDS831_g00907 [Diplodia seriata]|uniref:FHA domain-containing protein n=1 Tax=Diplodia seriata TaxID=420778 RepID=A0A0G2EWZ4_9PEZI|nr:hypothetical protein UCDDS831_g00907 [Diplodia seriata]